MVLVGVRVDDVSGLVWLGLGLRDVYVGFVS
jgi:hypothetical protein